MLDSSTTPSFGTGASYLGGIVCIIISLGLAKTTDSLSWIIEHRKSCRGYWVHWLGLVLLALLQIQYAWATFDDLRAPTWTFASWFLTLLTPLLYLFASDLLSPNNPEATCDFRVIFRDRIRFVAGLAITAQVVNMLTGLISPIYDSDLGSKNAVRGVAVGVLLLLFSKNDRVHMAVFVVLTLLMLAYCILLTKPITP